MTKSNNQQDYMSVKINGNDATWILTSSFIIFTMQTGFSLLQSGMVRRKNQISIMIMNMFNPIVSGIELSLNKLNIISFFPFVKA